MPTQRDYNLAHKLRTITTLPTASIVIILMSYGIFYQANNSTTSIIIATLLFIFYFSILYYLICPYIVKKESARLLVITLIIFTTISTVILHILFALKILTYPVPYDTTRPPFIVITSIFITIGSTVYLASFSLYFIQNTYLLSIESYHLLQKSYQSEINALRLQMNPHYISNAINNLNHIIRTGNAKEAMRYNNELIDLLKNQMKFTNANTVKLKEELSWVEYYLQMEQQRMLHSFSYHISIDDTSLYDKEIPPMLLQPIVENSIIHGFSKEIFKGDGTININIKLAGKNTIIITVSDNGAGINANKSTKNDRPSIATFNINKRINLINETRLFHIKRTQNINHQGCTNTIHIEAFH